MSRPRRSSLIAVFTVLLPLVTPGCLDLFVGPETETGRLRLSDRLAEGDGASEVFESMEIGG